MSETRVQIAYHFKFDPAKETPGLIRIPELITRTIAVGDEIIPVKVSAGIIPEADRAAMLAEMEKQVREATRTARSADAPAAGAGDDKEESAF
jgi:hypothetical protein